LAATTILLDIDLLVFPAMSQHQQAVNDIHALYISFIRIKPLFQPLAF